MKTVLSDRMMDAVMVLRRRGVYVFPCEVLVDGARYVGLLGPRLVGCPRDVRVRIADEIKVYPIGQVSVEADVLAQITAIVAERDAAAAEAQTAEETDSFERISRALFAQRGQARRRPSGRYAPTHMEPAGRR